MVYDGKNYFSEAIGIFVIIFIIQVVVFCFYNKLGILLVLGFIFYILLFISRDKKTKKEELDRVLYRG